jgi:hypothetical protein
MLQNDLKFRLTESNSVRVIVRFPSNCDAYVESILNQFVRSNLEKPNRFDST